MFAPSWPVLLVAAWGCDYQVHAPAHDASRSDAGAEAAPPDAGADAAGVVEDAGPGDGPWFLQQGMVELHELDCPVAAGQRVFARVTVIAPTLCHEPGPAEVRLGDREHDLRIVGWYWAPAESGICADMNAREDRWLDLGVLEQGTWTLRSPERREEVTIEVGPPPAGTCAERAVERGGSCTRDCDCASERCVPDLDGATCDRRCGDLPCGAEPDCLQGRCEAEMPPGLREGFLECLPAFGTCAQDADCPPVQSCGGAGCVFRQSPEPFEPCTRGADCPRGWSCVVDELDREHGVCAVRCFTDRTPCPTGECTAAPGFGLAWTCSTLAD